MKKVLFLVAGVLLLAACSSSQKQDSSAAVTATTAKHSQGIIVDQEFENVKAPDMNYKNIPSYETQLKSSGTFVKGTKGKKTTKTGK